MEALDLLEKKIKNLVEFIAKLKDENVELKAEKTQLTDENAELSQKIQGLTKEIKSSEGAILENSKSLEDLNQEKALTKTVVDDLIKSIDSFVKENQQ